ncbi:DEAD/DEAH box helicase [Cytobacillus sp. BC1816]|uniref:DEAD/DEAH box helicase n=1 Tax=Cytobacillus sp. BC1816 TaxID=3440154 RepID=UPI003F510188
MKNEEHQLYYEKLYSYQQDAVQIVDSYLKSKSQKQCLIKMPTGTGKTVIIGYVSNFYKKYKNILVISPSDAVTRQLHKELKTDLKNKLNINQKFKAVERLYKSNANEKKDKENIILVATMKAIDDIKKTKETYETIKNKIDLIIFDEGHREPASGWRETIRNLNKKVILFSATPIRNDNKGFIFDRKYFYNYSIQSAVRDKHIREAKFCKVDCYDIESFIDKSLEKIKVFRIENGNPDIKVIFRVEKSDDIKEIKKKLIEKYSEESIAIHDNFNKEEDLGNYKNVPDSAEINEIIWIHQNKVIEGIDNNQFSVLCIYSSFRDVRSLVQQVGRVIRKNDDLSESLVIYKEDIIDQKKLYQEYLYYEKRLENNPSIIDFNFDEYFNKVIEILPPVMHTDKRFLTKVNFLKSENLEEYMNDFRIPLKTNVFVSKGKIEDTFFKNITEITKLNLIENHAGKIIYEISEPKTQKLVLVYALYKNSPILMRNFFLETKLGITIIKLEGDYLFHYDSNNLIVEEIFLSFKRISPENLEKLYDEDSMFKELTIKNGIIANNNIRRQTINTEDINAIAPSITDKYKFCTTIQGTAKGHDNHNRTRYVGFNNSRVSDSSELFSLSQYFNWLKFIKESFINTKPKSHVFKRFAPVTKVPKNKNAVSVLLDIAPLRDFLHTPSGKIPIIQNLTFRVNEEQTFNFNFDENTVLVKIDFDKENNIYRLIPDEKVNLDILHRKEKVNLFEFLNKTQKFQIITQDTQYVYNQFYFYQLNIEFNDQRLQPILIEYTMKTGSIANEKGEVVKKKLRNKIVKYDWDDDSLFRLVSSQGLTLDDDCKESELLKEELKSLNYLICTDLNKEIADFIGLNEKDNKVYFIHCKAGDSKLSASAFQDICGQITKNLDYTHPLSIREPKDVNKWDGKWENESYCISKDRLIINEENLTSKQIWDKIKDISRKPESETFVWALLGNMFSIEEYKKEKSKGINQKPEVIQIDYILMSTWEAIQETGAKFRVFFDKK